MVLQIGSPLVVLEFPPTLRGEVGVGVELSMRKTDVGQQVLHKCICKVVLQSEAPAPADVEPPGRHGDIVRFEVSVWSGPRCKIKIGRRVLHDFILSGGVATRGTPRRPSAPQRLRDMATVEVRGLGMGLDAR